MAGLEGHLVVLPTQTSGVSSSSSQSWFSGHWLTLLIIVVFCVVSGPFLMSLIGLLQEVFKILNQVGDGLATILDLLLAAIQAIVDCVETQKWVCVVTEIAGGVGFSIGFISFVASKLVRIYEIFSGKKTPLTQDPEKIPMNQAADVAAAQSGRPKTEVRAEFSKEGLESGRDSQKFMEGVAKGLNMPYSEALNNAVGTAVGHAELARRYTEIANLETNEDKKRTAEKSAAENVGLMQAEIRRAREEAKKEGEGTDEEKEKRAAEFEKNLSDRVTPK